MNPYMVDCAAGYSAHNRVFVHETIAFALIFTSEWASPMAVCIIELSPKFEYVLFFTSNLMSHQEVQKRVYSSLP